MKRLLSIIFILLILLPYFNINVQASNDSGYFVVTAYYSPLPNQENYSYSVYTNRERTYEEEKRLQGQGIRGASGQAVFSGMLAAPKNYRFGTKIYLEGLGIGEVADRGGAIVNKGIRGHNYDRIDVWMGYGDEGLNRASNWGKRTIKGSLVNKYTTNTIDYKSIKAPKLKQYTKIISKKSINIFDKKLTTKIEIQKLQEIFQEMDLYSGIIDGEFKSTINSIYNFQLSKNIVKGEYSPGAGSYGPITRKALKSEYDNFLVKKEEKRLELVRIDKEKKKEEVRLLELAKEYKKLEELSFLKAENKLNFIGSPKFGEISHSVRELQVILKQLGYFDNKDTAIYGMITKESIISYQIDKKIINHKDELGAGIVGPKTRESLKNDLKEQFLKEIVKKENTIIKI